VEAGTSWKTSWAVFPGLGLSIFLSRTRWGCRSRGWLGWETELASPASWLCRHFPAWLPESDSETADRAIAKASLFPTSVSSGKKLGSQMFLRHHCSVPTPHLHLCGLFSPVAWLWPFWLVSSPYCVHAPVYCSPGCTPLTLRPLLWTVEDVHQLSLFPAWWQNNRGRVDLGCL
jgi:hypothetical protein